MTDAEGFVYYKTSDNLVKHFDKDEAFEIEFTLIEEGVATASAILKIINFSLLTLNEQHKFVKTFSNGNGFDFDVAKQSSETPVCKIELTEELLPLIRTLLDGKRVLGHGKFVLLLMIINGEINPKHTTYLKTLLENQIPYLERFALGADYDRTYLSPVYSNQYNRHHKLEYFHSNYDVVSNLISFLRHYGDKTWGEFCDMDPAFKLVSTTQVGVYNTLLIVMSNIEVFLKYLKHDSLKKLDRRSFIELWYFVKSFIPELQPIVFSKIVKLEDFDPKANEGGVYPFTDEERASYKENCPFLKYVDADVDDTESYVDRIHFRPFNQVYAYLLVEHGLEAAQEFVVFYETKLSDVNIYLVFFEDVIKYYGTCNWESYGSLNLGLMAEGLTGCFDEWK